MTCLSLVAEWLRHLEANGYSRETLRTYSGFATRFLAWLAMTPGPKEPLDVTEQILDGYLASIGAQGPTRTDAAVVLRSFYGYAARRGRLRRNPAEHLRPRPVEPPVPDAFTDEELGRLLLAAAWRDPRRAWAMLLCYSLGTRRSELCAIRPDQLDRVDVEVRGKGSRRRMIPLSALAREAVAELLPGSNGTLLAVKPQTFTMWVNRAAKDAGFPPERRRAHLLRASFASHLDWAGAPTTAIRDLLGHRNIATTQRYLASRMQDRREAVLRVFA